MLSKHISTAFDGVNSESINWMKHYLNGGDDVGAAWNGICDSVSGYTYKYSNQFEFDIKKSDITTDNLTGTVFGYECQYLEKDGIYRVIPYSAYSCPVTVPQSEFDLTFARLPFPDLPGVLFVKCLSGKFVFNPSVTIPDVGSASDKREFTQIAIPIEDPNWTPDSIKVGRYQTANVGEVDPNYFMNWHMIPKFAVDVIPGFSKDITGYRLAGASFTFNCTAPAILKNGTIVAVGATTPYKYGNTFDCNLEMNAGVVNEGDTTRFDYYAQDLPVGYTTISSVKSYHKYRMNEGVYCVLHNTQGVYLFNNIEDNHQIFNGSYTFTNGSTHFELPSFRVYNNGSAVTYPIVFMRNKTIYDRYTSYSCIPRYFIPDSPITEWNTCVVSPTQTNSDDTLIYTCKFNSYVECYVSSFSRLKPSVTMTSMYYPRLLEYLSGFYHKFDGIYPSSWNDGNHIWELFKRFLSSGALNAAVTAVNPTAGAIVPIIQSIAQKYFNRMSGGKDQKLSRKEKQQTSTIANNDIKQAKAKSYPRRRGQMVVSAPPK